MRQRLPCKDGVRLMPEFKKEKNQKKKKKVKVLQVKETKQC